MNRYTIGFDCGYWNCITSVCDLRRVKELAAEIAEEYGEMPEIRKEAVKESHQYAIVAIHAHGGGYGDYFRKGETCLLTHAPTYKEACAAKADFQRTRREDFTRIWIEKVSGEYGEGERNACLFKRINPRRDKVSPHGRL